MNNYDELDEEFEDAPYWVFWVLGVVLDCWLGFKKVLFFVFDFVLEVVGLLMIFGLCVFIAICSGIMRVFGKDSQGRILP